jgi:type IV pilus assembly protein PilQ
VKRRCGLVLALLATGAAVGPLAAAPRATGSQPESTPAATSNSSGGVALSLRRSPDGVQLVIEGTGAGPVLQQSRNGDAWRGDLRITTPGSLRVGPQRMTLPEAGLQSVSFGGSGTDYQIEIVSMPGATLSRPLVSADGSNLILSFAAPPKQRSQTAQPNLRQPGVVPQPSYAPPLQPRAVAPPLGDMAVGTMVLRNRSYLNVSGPPVTMTLRNAPAKDALMALAQMGGYGFVYLDEEDKERKIASSSFQSGSGIKNDSTVVEKFTGQAKESPPVTVSFSGEAFSRAMNFLLLASGLEARLEGRIIVAGKNAGSRTISNRLSKVFRLNQASASSAADYLASLGAMITKVTSVTNVVSTGQPSANQVAGAAQTQQTKQQTTTETETYGSGTGPLRGLIGTTDSRLRTITLVGDSQLVAVAENYLRQIDLRQRQVALSVKILDVTLNNDAAISNSFAFRSGSNFVVSDRGQLLGAFGQYLPPNDSNFNAIAGGAQSAKSEILTAAGQQAAVAKEIINPVDPAPVNPGSAYGNPSGSNYFDFVRALIESNSTKVLASPTLIISENAEPITSGAAVSVGGGGQAALNSASIGRPFSNESFVTVGAQEIVSYTVQAGQNGAPNSCQPEFGTAGLTFGARVSRIDDNGFVTFSMSPEISAVVATDVRVEGCGLVNTLTTRRLDTGEVRVRDGQTLILTGVISDVDQSVVRKWPVLGDIPFVGQFFRDSTTSRAKRELVIMVSPRIIRDDDGGSYGYGYQAATPDARQFLSGSVTPNRY